MLIFNEPMERGYQYPNYFLMYAITFVDVIGSVNEFMNLQSLSVPVFSFFFGKCGIVYCKNVTIKPKVKTVQSKS